MKKNLMMILAAVATSAILPFSAWGAAEMNGTAYGTLSAAIQAAPTDGTAVTITMTAAETYSGWGISVPGGANITLDLNGFKVTVTGAKPNGVLIVNNARLVITDTSASGTGEISKTDSGSSCKAIVLVRQNGVLEVAGGTVKAAFSNNGINQGDAILIDDASASVSVTGGTVRGNTAAIRNSAGGTINISGGTVGTTTSKPHASVFAYAIASNGPVTISDGTVECLSSDGQAIATGDGASTTTAVQISGGTVTSVGSAIVPKNSTLEMTGGSVSGNAIAISALNNSTATIANSTVTSPSDAAKADATSEVTFLGGSTYSGALDGVGVEIQEGAVIKDNGDGSYTVKAPLNGVVNSVRSANVFGAIKMTGVASNMFVAVPFEGFEASGAARKASEVVHPAGLADGTKMYVYDSNADKYDVFQVSGNVWTKASKVTVGADGTVSVDNPNLERPLSAGSGVIVDRKSMDAPVYVYGQIPSSSSVTLAEGASLVCAPSTNALAAVDLNTLKWTGVTASGCNSSGTRLKSANVQDVIRFRGSDNKMVNYYYFNGKWGAEYRPSSWDGKAMVPAGTAFWYTAKSAGGVKMEW